jgi:hypothetical protein
LYGGISNQGEIKMAITSINGLQRYLKRNCTFTGRTINSIINALGYSLHGTQDEFKELSGILKDCSSHGADAGFTGFSYYSETIRFFRKHRFNIVSHMEQTAAECGTDIISMVQNFGVFRNNDKPTTSEVGRALWDSSNYWPELNTLYNVFAWYALEEISHTWYRYLEDNPAVNMELSA